MKITITELRQLVKEAVEAGIRTRPAVSKSRRALDPALTDPGDLADTIASQYPQLWKLYSIPGASYEELMMKIPVSLIRKHLGLTIADLQKIQANGQPYEASIDINPEGDLEFWNGD